MPSLLISPGGESLNHNNSVSSMEWVWAKQPINSVFTLQYLLDSALMDTQGTVSETTPSISIVAILLDNVKIMKLNENMTRTQRAFCFCFAVFGVRHSELWQSLMVSKLRSHCTLYCHKWKYWNNHVCKMWKHSLYHGEFFYRLI